MTEEELRKDYYADRPSEPYSDDDRPSDWANIAHYAEENLENAFKRIEELGKENTELKARLNAINLLTPELEKSSKLKKQQLTRAKEFLNEFMRISKVIDEDFEHDYSELIGETEIFLKEVSE